MLGHGGLGYNVDLVAGIALGTLFRFWAYRKHGRFKIVRGSALASIPAGRASSAFGVADQGRCSDFNESG